MDSFKYRKNELHCEDVPVRRIAETVGTPVWIYSSETLIDHYRKLADAFAELSPTVCFSLKSLSNLHVLELLATEGCGFDVTSGGELTRALEAGEPGKIVFAGVGKTDDEIRLGIEAGIKAFNVESEAEFENLSRLAAEAGKPVRACLRVNPDVYDPKTHTYTVTGKKESKFGVDIERAVRFFREYSGDDNVKLDGIHIHIGSPIYSPQPYVEAIQRTLQLIDRLREEGFEIGLLDLGGGYAADYEEGASPSAAVYAQSIVPLLRGTGLEIVIEPGRQISCNAGILLGEVQYVKTGGDRNFAIVDSSMTDLIRPALYGGDHFIYPAVLESGAPLPQRDMNFAPEGGVKVDVVGGVCESSDFLGKDRILPPLRRGDLLAVFGAGAYGFTMSSNYNTRPRAPEVLVQGDSFRVVRRRETYQDLLALERGLEE
jgi:diaminopimelate decarboxylase